MFETDYIIVLGILWKSNPLPSRVSIVTPSFFSGSLCEFNLSYSLAMEEHAIVQAMHHTVRDFFLRPHYAVF